jgi:small subunit ribosomal protein S2
MIDLKQLIAAGVHFGHKNAIRVPRMMQYIWGTRNGVTLIDVSQTARHLDTAGQFLESVAASGKAILWVGTKRSAQIAIRRAGQTLNHPFVDYRWIGGTLSNYSQVRKSVTRMLHFEDVVEKSGVHYTKKEISSLQKIVRKLENNIGGIRNLTLPIGAMVIVDVKKEQSALKEAVMLGIPVVAVVDTNSDPALVDYVIPGNDDSAKSVDLLVAHLIEATQKGQQQAAERKVAKEAEGSASKEGEIVRRSEEVERQVAELAKEVAAGETKKKPKRAATKNKDAEQAIAEEKKEENA